MTIVRLNLTLVHFCLLIFSYGSGVDPCSRSVGHLTLGISLTYKRVFLDDCFEF